LPDRVRDHERYGCGEFADVRFRGRALGIEEKPAIPIDYSE